jgi:Arc/MetJ family transcription regulator
MRTNIDIDGELLKKAMAATGTSTKKAAVEACLSEVVQLRRQGRVRKIFGIGGWEGDLRAMREGRLPEWEAEQSTVRAAVSAPSEEVPAH